MCIMKTATENLLVVIAQLSWEQTCVQPFLATHLDIAIKEFDRAERCVICPTQWKVVIREVCTLSFDDLIHLYSHCNDAQPASLCIHGHLRAQRSRNVASPRQDT